MLRQVFSIYNLTGALSCIHISGVKGGQGKRRVEGKRESREKYFETSEHISVQISNDTDR